MKALRLPAITPLLRWFLLAMVLANIAGRMVFTLLAVYLAELGASVAQIGIVFSAASLVPLALQIFGGWLSDTIGRLRTIAIGSAAATFGYIGFVLAPNWQWMLVALCLEYISSALVTPSFGAIVAEQSDESSRGRVFGLSQAIFMIVGVLGPLLSGLLTSRFGFRPMLVCAAFLYASATLLRVWMAVHEQRPVSASAGSFSIQGLRTSLLSMAGMLASGGILTWILIVDGVYDISYRLSEEIRPVFFSQVGGLDVQQIGWLGSIFGLAIMLTTLPAGWVSDRYSERVAIAAGFGLQAVGILIFLLAGGLPAFGLSIGVYGVGMGMAAPAFSSLVSKAVPEHQRGIAFGLYSTSIGIFSLAAPWLGAQLWERFNPYIPFSLTALLSLLVILPVWFKLSPPGSRAGSRPHADNQPTA